MGEIVKNSTVPPTAYLYEYIALDIKQKIDEGIYQAGEKLPNEYELCDIYDTSRITVRRSLKELVEQDYVVIKQGVGTFVKERTQRIHMVNLHGFSDGLSVTREHIQKEILSKEIIESNDQFEKYFQREDSFEMIKLKRLITDEQRTISVDNAYFPVEMYPDLFDKLHDEVSTFALLREDYKVRFARTNKEIELIYPDNKLRDLFGEGLIGPLYMVKKIIYDDYGTPVHYSRYYLDPTNVKIIINADVEY